MIYSTYWQPAQKSNNEINELQVVEMHVLEAVSNVQTCLVK